MSKPNPLRVVERFAAQRGGGWDPVKVETIGDVKLEYFMQVKRAKIPPHRINYRYWEVFVTYEGGRRTKLIEDASSFKDARERAIDVLWAAKDISADDYMAATKG